MAVLPFDQSSLLADPSKNLVVIPIEKIEQQIVIQSKPKSNLTRTKTSIGPLIYEYPKNESNETDVSKRMKPLSRDEDSETVYPVKQQVQGATGETFMSVRIPVIVFFRS